MLGGETKKRKQVVSGGSSGNAKLFVDKDAKKRYDTFIAKRHLLLERDVYLDELFFYANVNEYKENELTFKTLVRKKSITVSPDLISNILKIDIPDFPENSIIFPYSCKEQVPEMAM
ncbi:unnamed protein product, partial [Ilex paraguariensis]